MSEVCNKCGQKIQTPHKEELNAMKLGLLRRAADHVMDTMVNDFRVRDFAKPEEFKRFHNFQKLRYHGLVTPVRDRDTGQRIKGRWLITRNGWAFLRGDIGISKYVLVKNNSIVGYSDKQINVYAISHGLDAIQTTFEYFDDSGQPVGFRPTLEQSRQLGFSL
jgi:hypothetical protein